MPTEHLCSLPGTPRRCVDDRHSPPLEQCRDAGALRPGAFGEAAFLAYVLVFGRRAVAAGQSADIENPPDTLPVAA
jgi:hypothetical protein